MNEYGQWRFDIDRKTEGLGEKSVPLPLCLPKIPLDCPGTNLGLHGEKLATKCAVAQPLEFIYFILFYFFCVSTACSFSSGVNMVLEELCLLYNTC
jgi:hypothetical protein